LANSQIGVSRNLLINGIPSAIGVYPYTITTTGINCSVVNTTGVITITNSIVPIFSSIGPFCQNSSATVLPLTSNNSPSITGTWNPLSINTSTVGIQTLTFNPDPNQCASLTTIDIEITPLELPTFPTFGPFCVNETINQATLPQSSNEGVIGTWNPSTISTTVSGISTYLFTPNANQCSTVASLSVVVNDPISPSFNQLGPYTQNAIPGVLPNQSNDNPSISGSWSPTIIETSATGQFTFTFTPDPNSCAIPVTMDVAIQDETVFYVPNSFTPDQDEHNQMWGPIFTQGYDPYNFELRIFNRWGETIWLSYNADAKWDGSYGNNGLPVPQGIYTYKIVYKIKDIDKRITLTGHINLIR
jgi:gliding motility-associated-like protein